MIRAGTINPRRLLQVWRGAQQGGRQLIGRKDSGPLGLGKERADWAIVIVGSRQPQTVSLRFGVGMIVVVVVAIGLRVAALGARRVELVAEETVPARAKQGDAAEQGQEGPNRGFSRQSPHRINRQYAQRRR